MGMLKMFLYAMPRQLTVLSYHRIDNASRAGFDTFKPNVSATPGAFRQQMEYLKQNYNVICCEDLASWLGGRSDLPPRAALITFDDGYYDNLAHAYPVLRELGLPATIFLCTGHIGTRIPFYWDSAAYCFAHTEKKAADLPVVGMTGWADPAARDRIARDWMERVKRLSQDERGRAVDALPDALEVRVPEDAFAGLYLNWDQVREMSSNGIGFGAHTTSHPILSAVPPERAQREITASKETIEGQIGQAVTSFAYPNGGSKDFTADVMKLLRGAGIAVAFTLMPGPTRYQAVKAQPLAIRRVFIGRSDTPGRFALKLAGAARLRRGAQY